MQFGLPLNQLLDNVVSDGTLSHLDLQVAGIPIEIEAYAGLMQALGIAGYRDVNHPSVLDTAKSEHFTCFQFDYDWRRDISENAALLDDFIERKKRYVAGEYARRFGVIKSDIKFDLVAHSMGGLLTRYYLQYGRQPLPNDGSRPTLDWSGAARVENVVLVGTPNDGSVLALRDLVNGYQPSKLMPFQSPVVLGTMPSVYQMLPPNASSWSVDDRGMPIQENIFDSATWKKHGWGLAANDADKVLKELLPDVTDEPTRCRIAEDHLAKCLYRAAQMRDSLEIAAPFPSTIKLHLFAGDGKWTASKVQSGSRGGKIKVIDQIAGDDTTTLASALTLRSVRSGEQIQSGCAIPWTTITKVNATHRLLPSDPRFVSALIEVLRDPKLLRSQP